MKVHDFYRNNGLRVHEIKRGIKNPDQPGWPDSNKSADYVDAVLTSQPEAYNKYGWILDDKHVVVDIDVHNKEENGYQSLAKLEQDCGIKLDDCCLAVVNTPSGGRHYYFTKPDGVSFCKSSKKHYPGIDFISGKGKQVVAAGSEHDESPGLYELSESPELVEIPKQVLDRLVEISSGNEQKPMAPFVDQSRAGDEFNSSVDGLHYILGAMQQAGYTIRDAGNGSYEWDRPGKTSNSKCSGVVGTKSANGNYQLVCFTLADPNFPTGESITIFYAYALIKHGGDTTAAANDLYFKGFAVPDPGGVELGGLLATISQPAKKEIKKRRSRKVPFNPARVPGLIGDVVRHNLETAMYPQPELALASAISLMGVLAGRKITDKWGTRTNVYMVGVAPSGSGKEHGRKLNKQILMESDADKMIGPERIASSAGLVCTIAEQPSCLLQLDELGKLIQATSGPKAPSHLANIVTVLMQLYSSADSLFLADAYADAKKNKRINQPNCVLYGTTTAEQFWQSLSSDAVTDGLIGRLMALESHGYVDMQMPTQKPIPSSILNTCRWWNEFNPGNGNLGNFNPVPLVVEYSPEAELRIKEHLDGISQRRKKEPNEAATIWSRAGGKTTQLALIFAASRGGVSGIELDDVDRAIELSNYMTRILIEQVCDFVSSNDYESNVKRLLRCIVGRMTLTELHRASRWLRPRDRNEMLQLLESCGDIIIEVEEPNGEKRRPTTYIQRVIQD